jgi:hypothetical protein
MLSKKAFTGTVNEFEEPIEMENTHTPVDVPVKSPDGEKE